MTSDPRERRLILDVGGVLLADPIPILIDQLAQAGERPRPALRGFYVSQLREGLWSGTMAEDEFWSRILGAAGLSSTEVTAWRPRLLAWQRPLPAIERLRPWSARASVVLLSNHRSAWLRPALASAGLAVPGPGEAATAPGAVVRRALISEETGFVKPDHAAFRNALDGVPVSACLVVDDQPPNVAAAEATGFQAVLADGDGAWVARVSAWLGDGRPDPPDQASDSSGVPAPSRASLIEDADGIRRPGGPRGR